ncbi:MAG TPA: sialidase family protein [Ktedonobacterales bacterium]|nr:sialidase family protein [Ktedonobacterales bacterium]
MMRREVRGTVRQERADGIGWRGVAAWLLALALAPGLAACGGASSTVTHAQPTNTPLVFPTRTPTAAPANPSAFGWARIAAGHYGSAQFAASDPQRGYLCADDDASSGAGRVFGVSTDGGQMWRLKPAPTAYPTCAITVSPTDPLKLTISSINQPGDGQTAFVDAFASSDGGQTWQAAPIPANTLGPAGELWAGADLYLSIGPNKGQAPALQVSVNGGAFTPVDLSTLMPGSPHPSIGNALASSDTLYLTLQGQCSPNCTALVATSDGGKTWQHLANPLNLVLDAVAGSALYAHAFDGAGLQPLRVVRSSDGGATWSDVSVPALPDGNRVNYYLVAPDGTLFTSTPLAVFVLRGQAWSAITFAASGTWALDLTATATDGAGHPARVFVSYEGPHPGQFSHTV